METKKLICRHCKGNHLSLQCPTKKKVALNNSTNTSFNNKDLFKKRMLVIFKNLPEDIDKKEIFNLLEDWKPIGKINFKRYRKQTEASIEFLHERIGKKVCYQLDSTPFKGLFLSVKPYKL